MKITKHLILYPSRKSFFSVQLMRTYMSTLTVLLLPVLPLVIYLEIL